MLASLALSCTTSSPESVVLDPSFECAARNDDQSGYLQEICRYLAENMDSYQVDPNTLTITEVISGELWEASTSDYANSEHDFVGLSCCYTGDWAAVNKSSQEVVEFILGDV